MATILILIIGIAMFIWRMNANNDSQDAKVTQADQKAAVTTQKMTQAYNRGNNGRSDGSDDGGKIRRKTSIYK